jgi:hypothetical protein
VALFRVLINGKPNLVGPSSTVTSSMTGLVTAIGFISSAASVSIANANSNGQATMANSAPVAIASNQAAIPVTISSTGTGTNSILLSSLGFGGTNSSLSTPVVPADQYGQYTAVSSGQTQASLGTSAGRAGDYLAYVTVFPQSSNSGGVTIFDSTATTVAAYAGAASVTLPSLIPFTMQIGAYSISSGWKITTSSAVTVVAVGKFT